MLSFERYREAVENATKEIEMYKLKIEYRKLHIRKTFNLSPPNDKTKQEHNIETYYENDEELAVLKYKLKEMQSMLDFLKTYGFLPGPVEISS